MFGKTSDAFIAKLDPAGKVIWATYLGGILDDAATGIALDPAGNVVVAGWTRSTDFPVANAFQNTLNNGASASEFDGFVAKLDSTGGKLLYSTFLGGPLGDTIAGLAVDSAGNAFVTGNTRNAAGFPGLSASTSSSPGIFVSKIDPQGSLTWSFLHNSSGAAAAIALDSAGSAYVAGAASALETSNVTHIFGPSGVQRAIVFKLSPDGQSLLWETAMGGASTAIATSLAVGRDGSIYLGGSTDSVDFPLVKPLQSTLGARPLWKSTDAGATWIPIDDLPFAYPQALVSDPSSAGTLYVATADEGVLKSTNGGATWTKINQGISVANIRTLAIDPKRPQTLYAGSAAGAGSAILYKTVDGGASWTAVDSIPFGITQVVLDANSNIVYSVTTQNVARKSTDAGATWKNINFNGVPLTLLAADPAVSGNLFVFSPFVFGGSSGQSSSPFIWHSINGGDTWNQIPSPQPDNAGLLFDTSTTPSTVYNGFSSRSVDNGATWQVLHSAAVNFIGTTAIAVDSAGTLLANVTDEGLFASHDRGFTWSSLGAIASPLNSKFNSTAIRKIVTTANPATLYTLVDNPQSSGFVTRLSPDGAGILFSTFLRSHISYAYDQILAAEPPGVFGQNQINALTLDATGNIVVAGQTRGDDFPTANPLQSGNAGLGDAFIASITGDGGKLLYGTYIGGSRGDAGLAVSTGADGSIIVAGQTLSADFPGGVKFPAGQLGDAFVVKLAPTPPTITAVLNAASNQPGIESGSWVAIKGTNLANTTRTWFDDEVVNGNLPTSLDGVSATINGKAAFVYFISPIQINVQAPTDATTGPVDVIVKNNGAISAAFTAQMQSAAPAFFTVLGTSTAIASRLPDYSLTVRAGDTIVLWGTGFGPTNPDTAAGSVVKGAPGCANTPIVTIGGAQVPVLSAVLTTGAAGLYQITVQLPANIAAGTQPVQATVGTVKTPSGVTVTIAQ